MKNQPDKSISHPIADVWIDDEDIIWIVFNSTNAHTLDDAMQVVAAHNRLADDQPRAILADLRKINVGANRRARKYYVSEEASRLKLAMAMVTRSSIQRMAGNLFLKLSKPPYPTRIFASTPEAIVWLQTFSH
jgi:hypothetical protein